MVVRRIRHMCLRNKKQESEVLQAVKQFANEIGARAALICDAERTQISKAMKTFCNEIGTTLRALVEGTPSSNKAELYIGLTKEAVRKLSPIYISEPTRPY